jgi:NTE family protein
LAAQIFSKRYFSGRFCNELPEKPLLIINATCLKSIRSWRFTRYGLGCSRIGHAAWEEQALSLGECVGASAAFPPVFTPTRIESGQYKFSGALYKEDPIELPKLIALTDGGVYENLGTEALTKRKGTQIPTNRILEQPEFLLVSDAGYPPQYKFRKSGIPVISEGLLLFRVDDIARTQVNALRIRNLVERYKDPNDPLKGVLAYLASNTTKTLDKAKDNYYTHVGIQHRIPDKIENKIQSIRTHLDRFSSVESEALMYHAYTLSDTAL